MKSSWLYLGLILIASTGLGCKKEPEFKTRIVQSHDGFRLQVMDNSDTISQAIAINAHAHVLGVKERKAKIEGVFENVYYFDDGEKTLDLPGLDGFTNSEVQALSNNGRAVGFASRVLGHPDGSLTALLWEISENKVINLSHVESDFASHAQDISADGTRIVGYSTGREPERLRPCLWEYDDEKKKWVAEALPTVEAYNPYTMSSSVRISPDGKVIVACITDSFANNILDSSLYVWRQDTTGSWNRRKMCDEQMYLGDVNDSGLVVGDFAVKGGKRIPCIVQPDGKFELLELFEGTDSGKASDVTNAGVVIGVCNDPPGPDGGPHPFIYQDGKMSPLELPPECTYCLVHAINEKGQIAGLGDVTFKDRLEKNPETGKKEPVVKALAFIWDGASQKD